VVFAASRFWLTEDSLPTAIHTVWTDGVLNMKEISARLGSSQLSRSLACGRCSAFA
jgi:hypothetical protein